MSLNDNAGRSFAVEYKGRQVSGRIPRTVAPLNALRREAEKVFGAAKISEPWLPDGLNYRRVATVEMSFDDWAAIQSNPRQRNEVVRIEQGRVGHLLNFDPIHLQVSLAELPNGKRYKLDGHTRTKVWQLGLVARPKYLSVDVYRCADETAAAKLYDRFDNSVAGELGTDRVTGAYREAGIDPKSPMLREGGISTAIRSLYHYLHRTQPERDTKNDVINSAIKLFADEIEALDSIAPNRIAFPVGVVMGALLTLAENETRAKEFWAAYLGNAGFKMDGRMDAVEALAKKRSKAIGKGNQAMSIGLMSASVAAFHGYLKGSTYDAEKGISEKSRDALRKYADRILKMKTEA